MTDAELLEEERKKKEAAAMGGVQPQAPVMDMSQENPDFGAMLRSSGIPDSNVVAQVPGIENVQNPGVFNPVQGRDRITPSSGAAQAATGASASQATPSVTPTIETPSGGAQGQVGAAPQGEAGSPQAFFANIRNQRELTPEEIARGEAKAAEMGTTFDPNVGFSRKAFEDFQAAQAGKTAPAGGLTTVGGAPLSEFLSGQAMPERGFTQPERPMAGRGVTLTPEQMDELSAEREARLEARPDFGDAVSDRDRRAARGEGISMADRTAMAKANARGASPSEVARGNKIADELGVDLETGQPLQPAGDLTPSEQLARERFEFDKEQALIGDDTSVDATDRKIATIKQANPKISDEDAAAIASGSVRVVSNPITGETQLLNLTTGQSAQITGQSASDVDFDVAVPEETLFSRAGDFTGFVETTKRKAQGITGQVGLDVATEESLRAAQDFETAQNELVRAFRESSRYAASEAAALKKELNISLSPFEDPKSAEAKLRSIDKSLARRYENEVATFRDTTFPPSDRQDARMRAKAIAEFRANLGVPPEAQDSISSTQGKVPQGVDPKDWAFMAEEQRKLFN